MDGRRFIDALFSNPNNYSITQVVMNLPNDAAEFLGMLISELLPVCTFPFCYYL